MIVVLFFPKRLGGRYYVKGCCLHLGDERGTAGLDYPLFLDKAVTAVSGGRLLTFLYLAISFALFLNLIYLVIFVPLFLFKPINVG
jgi:hypothetical protein